MCRTRARPTGISTARISGAGDPERDPSWSSEKTARTLRGSASDLVLAQAVSGTCRAAYRKRPAGGIRWPSLAQGQLQWPGGGR